MRIETEKRRAAILRHLNETPRYTLNAQILLMGAEAQGIPTTTDQMEHALSWLDEMELVTVSNEAGVLIATLRTAGQEVALGKRVVAGVARPGPEG